jgi:phosphate-selective porin OprO and OprP
MRGAQQTLLVLLLLILPAIVHAERIYFAGYNGGFFIRSEEDGGMEMRLGGALDADCRYYAESQRADNRFDIRKARLMFRGQITRWFRYGLEYEFQGAETNNLLEAWGEFVGQDLHAIRMGQFKEPFSLEWQTPDKALWFAERSMGNCLIPLRDVGAMVYGNFLSQKVSYAFGAFNGDGIDGSTRGNEEDAPELTGRIVFKPLNTSEIPLLSQAQVGASACTARIDIVNVDLKVKTTGMVGLSRNVYVLGHDTKFGVLRNVDARTRLGMDGAWAYGPFALTGEYMHLKYTGLETATHPKSDADFSDWYLSAAVCLTGEGLSLAGGVVNPILPKEYYDPEGHTKGAFLLALRTDHFKGDKNWITPGAFVSTCAVDSNSVALTWYFLPMCRLLLDYTRSEFADDIIVRTNLDGSVDYIDKENVVTLRLSFEI